jgi:hypothetical protein
MYLDRQNCTSFRAATITGLWHLYKATSALYRFRQTFPGQPVNHPVTLGHILQTIRHAHRPIPFPGPNRNPVCHIHGPGAKGVLSESDMPQLGVRVGSCFP